MAAPKKYPDELRERAVYPYRRSDPKPVIRRLAEQLNVHHETLRNWIRQDEADGGERADRPTTDVMEENQRLRREVAELRRPTPSDVVTSTAGVVPNRQGTACYLPGRRRRGDVGGRPPTRRPGPAHWLGASIAELQ